MSRKKQAIVEAGKELFLKQGIAETTMEQVAEKAPVSKMTIYNSFGNKEGLLDAVIGSMIDEALPAFEEACAGAADPLDALRRIAATKHYKHFISAKFVDELREQHPHLMKRLVDAGEGLFVRRLEEIILEGQRLGQIRRDLSPFVIVSFIRTMREYVSRTDVLTGADDMRVAGEQVMSILYHGIVTVRTERDDR